MKLDLRTSVEKLDIIINTSERIHKFDIPVSEHKIDDTGYTFKLYQKGEEVYDLGSLLIVDKDYGVIKFYKTKDFIINKGKYNLVLENKNLDNPNVYLIMKGFFEVV